MGTGWMQQCLSRIQPDGKHHAQNDLAGSRELSLETGAKTHGSPHGAAAHAAASLISSRRASSGGAGGELRQGSNQVGKALALHQHMLPQQIGRQVDVAGPNRIDHLIMLGKGSGKAVAHP